MGSAISMNRQMDNLIIERADHANFGFLRMMTDSVKAYVSGEANWDVAQADMYRYIFSNACLHHNPPKGMVYVEKYAQHCPLSARYRQIFMEALRVTLQNPEFPRLDFKEVSATLERDFAAPYVEALMNVPEDVKAQCDAETAQYIQIGNAVLADLAPAKSCCVLS
ncbi:MAG: hypothetical protein K1X28_03435 [Parachlamydiales bacterium]|nr:hypothetical protein [Parachlamydiales bacterium]